jgi:2-keto-4-pentenoate hydratase/2-oxohepta-3-ene-1,7-dioic acid hydratase in catechol pathway
MEMQVRVVRYFTEQGPRWGAVEGDLVRDLRGDPFGEWELGLEIGDLEDISLLAPVVPTKILCAGLNYAAHAAEDDSSAPDEPLLFFKPPSAVIGPDDPIVLPPLSEWVEHEAELALVIGRRCRDVRVEDAWQHVLGVTCANDVTARDLQQRDGQWTRAKGFDTFCPVGPWLVTGLTEAEASDLAVTCRVNGSVRQSGRTCEMVFAPRVLIAYAAAVMTLEPGDVILTGTPAGVGPLEAGDVVEVAVEGVGVLRNPVTE